MRERPPAKDHATFRSMQWRMLFAVMFCYAFYYTGRQNFAWVTAALITESGFTPTQVGWINGGMLLCYGIGQAVNGNLGDAFGARLLMSLGAILSFAMNWITSFTATPGSMLLTWSTNGYVQSLGFAPGGRLLANWWHGSERGRAFGFYLLAAGLSSVITYAICIFVLTHLGWRWVFRVPVLLLLVGGVVFAFVARNSPADAGFDADVGGGPTEEAVHERGNWRQRYLALVGNRSFLLACLTIGFESAARYGLLTWTPLVYLGPDWKQRPESLWIVLALPVGMALGAWVCGHLSDRYFGSNRTQPIALFLSCATVTALLLYFLRSSDPVTGIVLLFFAGFFVFGPQSTLWAFCGDLLGRHRIGTSIGVMDASAYAFAAVSEPLYGHIIESAGNSAPVFLLTACLCGLGVACISLVKR